MNQLQLEKLVAGACLQQSNSNQINYNFNLGGEIAAGVGCTGGTELWMSLVNCSQLSTMIK